MKISNTIIILFSILIFTLVIATFIGVKLQEGITYNDLTLANANLKIPNISNDDKINAIKTMKIQDDPNFSDVINGNNYSANIKVSLLNTLVNSALDTNLSGLTYANAWTTNITVKPL